MTDSVGVNVVGVEIINVDATDPNNALVNYQLLPLTATVSSATFTAPGATQTKTNLTGNFSFSFDQNNLLAGDNILQLSVQINGFSSNKTVVATRTNMQVFNEEFTSFLILFEFNGANVSVRVPVNHDIYELFYEFSYSVPIIPTSKTIKVGNSLVNITTPALLLVPTKISIFGGIPQWTEEHLYRSNLGDQFNQIMSDDLNTLPPQSSHFRSKRSSNNQFFAPGTNLQSVAEIKLLVIEKDIFPFSYVNKEIDVDLP